MLRDRLIQIRHLLNASGTVCLHLDNMEVHRARCVLDEVFGASNYLGTVVWQRTNAKNLVRRIMGTMHESVLVYGASAEAELRTVYLSLSEDYVARRFNQRDERGSYSTDTLTASSYRPHLGWR
jgi:adenine-specific DNA-methyltransferase